MKQRTHKPVSFNTATLIAAGLTFVSITLAGIFIFIGKPLPEQINPRVTAEYVVVGEHAFDGNQEAIVNVQQLPAAGARMGPSSGIVTGVVVQTGDEVSSGTLLFWVDQQPVIALETAVVFFRDMAQGMKGDDIAALQTYLVEVRGEKLTADGQFGASTTAAVNRWHRELGLPPSGVVPAGWFATIEGTFTAEVVTVQPGAVAPERTTVPVQESPRFQIQSVRDSSGYNSVPDGEYIFVLSGIELALSVAGEDITADGEALSVLLNGVESESTLTALSGRLKLATPTVSMSIPASAMLSGAAGTCLWVSGKEAPITDSRVLGATPAGGIMLTSPELSVGMDVLLNPTEMGKTCQ